MTKVIEKINAFCFFLEITALFIALIILGFDMLYVAPKFEPVYHGEIYSDLSKNPFDFSQPNALRYRILPSLIGYLTFLRGNLFFIIPLIFALFFIASVYWVYRRRGYTPMDSILFTGFIAFSSTIFIQLIAPGYTDAAFYFFLFLSFAFVKDIYWSALFFALGLLTHESCLFMLPALILYSRYIHKNKKSVALKHFVLLLIAVLPLLLYRLWVKQHVAVQYDLSFYFSQKNISFSIERALQHLPLGLFFVFKLFWIFPIYELYKTLKQKQYDFLLLLLVIIFCDVIQLIIAFDITRMLCLGFPIILLSAEKIKEEWEPTKFTRFVLVLTLLNFLVLQYFMSADGLIPLRPLYWPF
jgi:hypothetical protein